MAQRFPRLRTQVHSSQVGDRCLRRSKLRDDPIAQRVLAQRDRVSDVERANPQSAQAREMGTHSQGLSQISRHRPNVCPTRALRLHRQARKRHLRQAQTPDRHTLRLQLRRLAGTSHNIGPLTGHLLC